MATQIHAGCMNLGEYDLYDALFPRGSYKFNYPTSEGVVVTVEDAEQLELLREWVVPADPVHSDDYSVQCRQIKAAQDGETISLPTIELKALLAGAGMDHKPKWKPRPGELVMSFDKLYLLEPYSFRDGHASAKFIRDDGYSFVADDIPLNAQLVLPACTVKELFNEVCDSSLAEEPDRDEQTVGIAVGEQDHCSAYIFHDDDDDSWLLCIEDLTTIYTTETQRALLVELNNLQKVRDWIDAV